MTSAIAKMLALAAVVGLALGAPVKAQTASSEAFITSCNAHPAFFQFAVSGLDNDPEGLGRLCSCLATEFSGFSDDDYAMLIKDLEGTATTADRTAHSDYTGLELKARDALDKCLVVEGFADGTDPGATPAGESADMTKFDAACQASEMLLAVLGGEPDQAIPVRTSLCECLSIALAPQVSTEAAGILAQDLDGTATDESRAAYPGYPELESRAGAAFDSCFATAMPQQ
jgi:hypothetical protein